MKITIAREMEYVPEWHDNRDDAEPITFYLRYLTVAERQQCLDKQYVPDKHGGIQIAVKPDQERMTKLAVQKIEHLEVNGKLIKTGAELLATPGLDDLFMEVSLQILTMNAERDSKN